MPKPDAFLPPSRHPSSSELHFSGRKSFNMLQTPTRLLLTRMVDGLFRLDTGRQHEGHYGLILEEFPDELERSRL
ncbi:hypothetical protein WG66_011284 [Moniliophthora roreri]|nr:hypothetical protein WG66_011284 [Moniliophthora roreri]